MQGKKNCQNGLQKIHRSGSRIVVNSGNSSFRYYLYGRKPGQLVDECAHIKAELKLSRICTSESALSFRGGYGSYPCLHYIFFMPCQDAGSTNFVVKEGLSLIFFALLESSV